VTPEQLKKIKTLPIILNEKPSGKKLTNEQLIKWLGLSLIK